MRLFLLGVAVSSLTIVGTLANIMQITASIEIPPEDITSLVENPNGTFQGYKILNEIDGEIYIGGKETLIMYNATNLQNSTRSLTFEASVDPDEVVTCERIIAAENKERVCQHYIRLAEKVSSDSLLVCGTNKQTPRCDLVDLTTQMRTNFSGAQKTQHTVSQNTTARFHEGYLYVGFNEGTQANPSHISKFRVVPDDLEKVAETDDQNENFVNEPHFVGKPYAKGSYLYFFYRETAVEAVNQGKFVYSRVARICVNDTVYNGNFEIFVKARLNCSLQGNYPFYFNHIQDVIPEEQADGNTIFYAVFTTTPHGPASSAVCAYRLSDINDIFEDSKFKGKEATGKLPGPVDRPDYADKFQNCQPLNADERIFLKRNPLMDSLVPNYNAKNPDSRAASDEPLFYSTSTNFYSIAVDSVDGEKIFYIGTERGTIIKAYHSNDQYMTYEQEIWDAKSAVTGLRVESATRTLLVVTGEGLFRVNLEGCNANCKRECREFYYPYCTFSGELCHSKRSTVDTSNQKAVEKVKILSLPAGEPPVISSCNSRKVELTCEVKSSTLCGDANLIWKMGDSDILVNCTGENECQGGNSSVGHIVKFREIVRKAHYKLVHLTVDVHSGKTNETFTCLFDTKDSKKTVKIDMDDSAGCLTRDLYTQRKDYRNELEREKRSLDKCAASPDHIVTSKEVLFKRCSECPGNPEINDGA